VTNSHYRCTAFLEVHPLLKIAVGVLIVTIVAVFFHPAPAIAAIIVFFLHLLWCPGLILPALPILGFATFGFLGFSLVNCFAYSGNETVWYTLGFITISREAIDFALSIFLRVFASVTVAIWLTRSIHPAHLTAAIDGIAGRATGAGLAILVVHRLIPEVVRDFTLSRRMRQLRGHPSGLRGAIETIGVILAATIRRAETLAIAVRSRGYALGASRTAYRPAHVQGWHILWAITVSVVIATVITGWTILFGIDGFLSGIAEQASGVQ